jgi:uncharacterized protein YaaW (UPF0174 family)
MGGNNPQTPGPISEEGTLLGAIRGPVLLILLGVLLTIDHFGPYGFGRTWPALLIVFGLFKLFERAGARS